MTQSPRTAINNVTYLFLRRMRVPLVLVIMLYTVSVFGLAIMPGVDDAGNPTEGMGLFNAFVVIPQLLVATVMGTIMRHFFPTEPIWTMAFAGAVMLAAAGATLQLGSETLE